MKNFKQIMIFALVCLLLFSCSKESSSSSESNVAVKVDSVVETAKDDVSNTVEVVKEVVAEVVDLSVFEKVELLDDFGDPTGNAYIKAKKDFDGTYKNIDGVSDGNLKWNIKIEDGKVTFIIKEKGQVNQLSTAYYTTDEFDVKVKDNESGATTTYSGVVSRGEEGTYNCIEVKTVYDWFYKENDLASYLNNCSDCKVVISNDRGTYNLGALNGSEIEAIKYDFATFEKIKKVFEAGEYSNVLEMINALELKDIVSFEYFSTELEEIKFACANALGVYVFGQTGPAGGYIFYDCDADNDTGNADGLVSSECGWRYLEAAPNDLRVVNGVPTVDSSANGYAAAVRGYIFGHYKTSTSGSDLYVNGTTTYFETDCTVTAIGSGEKNTEKLVNAMGESAYSDSYGSSTTPDYAARLCSNLSHGGYDNWFLPSKDELDKMYDNLKAKGMGSFSGGDYWSSSEGNNSAGSAWGQNSIGYQSSSYRNYGYSIRPCRAF